MSGVRGKERGFTLVEVLIAIGIASLLVGSMYSVYTASHKSFRAQEQMAEAQQNARAAIQLMTRDIAMAGYSTVNALTPPSKTYKGIFFANRTSLTMQIYSTIGSRNKFISYSRYSNSRIGRSEAGTRYAVAERIRRLLFRYKDSSDTFLTPDSVGNVQPDAVKQILVSVTAGTPAFGAYSGSCTLETMIIPRNLP